MKSNYIKPSIAFTSLSVSGTISSGCALLSNQAEMVCPVEIPEWDGMTFFNDGQCDLIPAEQVCYHVPIADSNIFSS